MKNRLSGGSSFELYPSEKIKHGKRSLFISYQYIDNTDKINGYGHFNMSLRDEVEYIDATHLPQIVDVAEDFVRRQRGHDNIECVILSITKFPMEV